MTTAIALGRIPKAVIVVVGEAIGSHYYNHRVLDDLFAEHGAPGEPPPGNCVEKCQRWLKRCNEDPTVDPLVVLGGVLENFMDHDLNGGAVAAHPSWPDERARVHRVLAKLGMEYQFGGRVIAPGTGDATRTLESILRARDFGAVDAEFRRALQTVHVDPPAALTAACAIVEAFCKTYIGDERLTMPSDQTVKPLWKVVQGHLGLDPAKMEDADMTRILGGLASVVDGLAAIHTHAGSAHGRGRTSYKIGARHARLAVNAAHTLILFAIETWDARRAAASGVAAR